jgi:hypothetical protein
MGKVVSSLATWMWPGGSNHGEDDDLSHTYASFNDLSHKDADGNIVDFRKYEGKVVMVVNSARK